MKRLLLLGVLLLCSVGLSAQTAKPTRRYVDFVVLASESDCIYALGEEASLRVVAKAGGNALDGVKLAFEIGDDGMDADLRGTTYFRRGEAQVTIPAMQEAGFRHCTIQFEVEGVAYKETVKVGFGIHQIKPTIANPIDFDLFWRQVIKEARRTPLTVTEIPMPELSTEKVEVRMVRIPVFGEDSCIYGYLSLPRDGKKHPVLFVPPGAGVKRIAPDMQYAQEGFVTLVAEIHGLPMNIPDSLLAREKERIGNYVYTGIHARGDHYYKRVYAGCVRAVDYLMTLPEFDGTNVGVTGGSQGGALSIVTAALHEEVDFLSAFYPALCDVSGYLHGRAGGWPRMFRKSTDHPEIDRTRAMRTMAYYDVVNFARRIKAPGFYSYGFNDNTCFPTSVAAALNQIKAPKKIVTTPANYHWRYAETNQAATEWMKAQIQ